MITYFPRCR